MHEIAGIWRCISECCKSILFEHKHGRGMLTWWCSSCWTRCDYPEVILYITMNVPLFQWCKRNPKQTKIYTTLLHPCIPLHLQGSSAYFDWQSLVISKPALIGVICKRSWLILEALNLTFYWYFFINLLRSRTVIWKWLRFSHVILCKFSDDSNG